MASFKFGFVLICAFLISQVTPNPVVEDVQVSDLAKQVKKLIIDVTSFLDKLDDDLIKANSILSKDGLENFQKKTVQVTLRVLGELKALVDKKLDKIQPELNKDAQIVSKCLQSNGQEIINVIVDFYNLTTICFNPSLKPVLASLNPLIVDLQKIDKSVATFAPKLDKCDNDLCVFGIMAQVIKEIFGISDAFDKDLPVIKTNLKSFIHSVLSCVKKEDEPWEKLAFQVFNKVSACIRK